MKKLINDPRLVVREMLEGITDLHPGLALLDQENVVMRSDLPDYADRPVAVISGGGAGHEPAHAGYVGAGMLDAAVVGDVFTSPSVDAVFAAIRAVAGPRGVLVIIKNYTGDRLNFGLAAEMARAAGIPAEVVIVADDVSLHETVPHDRRRGIAGTVLVHKIAGALAARGHSLEEVAHFTRQVADKIGSMGVALDSCTVPAAGKPGFTLAINEIELGLGIHGEQGVARVPHQSADQLAEILLKSIIDDLKIQAGDRVVLLINNLGGTPPMEMSIVSRAAVRYLRNLDIQVERVWSGTFLTALEMPGCSLSLLKVEDSHLALFDDKTNAFAWSHTGRVLQSGLVHQCSSDKKLEVEQHLSGDASGPATRAAALACAAALKAHEDELTALDAATGDGDLGVSMRRGAEAIEAFCRQDTSVDAASVLTGIANALRRAIAGSSGPFYAIGLLRAARYLASCQQLDHKAWEGAFEAAVHGISELGGAQPGDRTMLDALQPALEAFKFSHDISEAATAAEVGAAATAQMLPRLGRASYLGNRALGNKDGGAVAVSLWLRAIADALVEESVVA